jgi:phage-related protein
MASEADTKTRASEADIKMYAEKARRTVDELTREARSRGEGGAEALRGIFSEKGNELSDFLKGAKGAEGVMQGAKGAAGKVVAGVGGAVSGVGGAVSGVGGAVSGVGGAVEQVGETITGAAGQKNVGPKKA